MWRVVSTSSSTTSIPGLSGKVGATRIVVAAVLCFCEVMRRRKRAKRVSNARVSEVG